MDPQRQRMIDILATMPDEAFGWFVLATLPRAMLHGAIAQIWPDGIGGFTVESRRSIEAIRAEAAAWTAAKQNQK